MTKDFQDVKGLEHCTRALEVAAAGGHSILLIGGGGTGKTMLAERLATITSRPVKIIDNITEKTRTEKQRARLFKTLDGFDGVVVATMRPCPCGNFTNPTRVCHCTPHRIQRHLARVPDFMRNRIDMDIHVPAITYAQLSGKRKGESSKEIRTRIDKTRTNAKPQELDSEAETLLKMAIFELGVSARLYDKIISVSKTIARLDGDNMVKPQHISEAIGYRNFDLNNF